MTRKAKVDIKVDKRLDTQELRQQAAALGAILSQQADQASRNAALLAEQSRAWATPRVTAARAWVGPRADKIWRDTVLASAPRVEAAAERVRPAVDSARDKIVDDYLPRVSKAMHDAAAAAAEDGTVRGRASRAGRAAQKAIVTPPKKQRGGALKSVGWVLVGTAAAGTGYLLWRRSQPMDDPWAEEYWDDTTVTSPGAESAPEEVKNAVGTAGSTGSQTSATAEGSIPGEPEEDRKVGEL